MGARDLATAADGDLVRRLDRDPAAVEEFYRRHVTALTRYATRRLGDPHDAADLVSATFLTAMQSVAGYDPARGEPAAWLYGIAANLIAARWRTQAIESRALAKIGGRRGTADEDEFRRADERLDAVGAYGPAEAVLARLKAGERELLTLITRFGLTVTEAAGALGIRPGTARMRLARARLRLAGEREG